MTVRVLLAVLISAALLASAIPAVEEAQRMRAEHQLSESAESIQTAAAGIARRNDPVPPGVPAARERVHVEVPESSTGATLRVGVPVSPGSSDSTTASPPDVRAVTTRVSGRTPTTYPVDVPIRAAGRVDGVGSAPLVLHEDAKLTLEYRLVDGRPTVVVTRGFKSGNRTTQSHVRTVRRET